MGHQVLRLLLQRRDCEVVCALERPGHPAIGQDVGTLVGSGAVDVSVRTDIDQIPDVLLDFSTPAACVARAKECAELGIPLVAATTGLSPEQAAYVEDEVACRVPVLRSANMSVGVNVLFRLVGQVARALGDGFDVEIVEMHHRNKKDAPSGTAMTLLERVCEARSWAVEEAAIYGRQGETGVRPDREVGVHAVRGGDVAGDHTVVFAGMGERLALTHRASSPEVFARGAVRAAFFLKDKPPGLYTVEDMLAP